MEKFIIKKMKIIQLEINNPVSTILGETGSTEAIDTLWEMGVFTY